MPKRQRPSPHRQNKVSKSQDPDLGDRAHEIEEVNGDGSQQDYVEDVEEQEDYDEENGDIVEQAGGAVSGKRVRGSKYSLPTPEESAQLAQSEALELFKSNLLQLECNELLEEVKVAYHKSHAKGLEEYLFALKDLIENLVLATVTPKSLKKVPEITQNLSRYANIGAVPLSLAFTPPTSMDIVGSYIQKTQTKPSLGVDFAVELPRTCLHERDHVNCRYLDKRALYVGHLYTAITASGASVTITHHKGDTRKPCLLVTPPAKNKTNVGGFVVRILVVVAPGEDGEGGMQPAKLAPGKSNCRRLRDRGAIPTPPPATPRYNSCVLEDMAPKRHTAAIFTALQECPSLRDAIMLTKVWLGQRGHRTSFDSLDGHGASLLLLHLLQQRRLVPRMTPLHMLQGLLTFIAGGGLRSDKSGCLVVRCSEDDPTQLTKEGEALYKSTFPCVLLDCGLGLNILWRVSESAITELEVDAKDSILSLQRSTGGTFSELFLTRASFFRRYDSFVSVPIHKVPNTALTEHLNAEDDGLCDHTLQDEVTFRIEKILRRGLGDRVNILRPFSGPSAEEPEHFKGVLGCSKASERQSRVCIGMLINEESGTRQLDKGPSAEEPQKSLEYRQFWGDKSELRRFKDGSIVEAVVWHGHPGTIIEQVVRHVLNRHDPSRCAAPGSVRFRGNEIYGLVESRWTGDTSEQALTAHGAIQNVGLTLPSDDTYLTRTAIAAFDRLTARLRQVEGIPLGIASIEPVCSELRYTSPIPPLPHPMAGASDQEEGSLWDRKMIKGSKMTAQVEVMDAIMKFEPSAKWPDQAPAIAHTAIAFLVRLSQCIEQQYKIQSTVVLPQASDPWGGLGCIDIMSEGYCFRLHISVGHAITALKLQASQGDWSAHEAVSRLIHEVSIRPQHHNAVHAFATKHPAYSSTVKAAMRWIHSHMLTDHLCQEAVELLVVSAWNQLSPLPYPSSPLSGILRFFLLIATHEWSTQPLVVNFHAPLVNLTPAHTKNDQSESEKIGSKTENKISRLDREHCEAAFEAIRKESESSSEGPDLSSYGPGASSAGVLGVKKPVPMHIVTHYDRENDWYPSWTHSSPEAPVLNRIRTLAKAAASHIINWLQTSNMAPGSEDYREGWKGLYRLSQEELQGFSVRLTIPKVVAADPHDSLCAAQTLLCHRVKGSKTLRLKVYKNLLTPGASTSTADLLCGFDTIQPVVRELKRRFGHLGVIFVNGMSPRCIGIVWRPKEFLPKPLTPVKSRYMMSITSEDGYLMCVPNVPQIMAEIKSIGGDLIEDVIMGQQPA